MKELLQNRGRSHITLTKSKSTITNNMWRQTMETPVKPNHSHQPQVWSMQSN